MATLRAPRPHMGERQSRAHYRSTSPSIYSSTTESDTGDDDDVDSDAPCDSAFDRLPDEIIQQYARQTSPCNRGHAPRPPPLDGASLANSRLCAGFFSWPTQTRLLLSYF